MGRHHIALAVKDIVKSKLFYEKLGFIADTRFADVRKNWTIMRNGDTTIGLYQDIIPRNTITFNPPDIFTLQQQMENNGVEFIIKAEKKPNHPAHFLIVDPDGNPLFFEQH